MNDHWILGILRHTTIEQQQHHLHAWPHTSTHHSTRKKSSTAAKYKETSCSWIYVISVNHVKSVSSCWNLRVSWLGATSSDLIRVYILLLYISPTCFLQSEWAKPHELINKSQQLHIGQRIYVSIRQYTCSSHRTLWSRALIRCWLWQEVISDRIARHKRNNIKP